MTNKNNGNVIQNSFNTMSLLELEDDSEFIEWCFLEGSERISELSRQLRTFLNYKNEIIRFRYSKSRESMCKFKLETIMMDEDDIFLLSSRYITLLKMIRAEDKTVTQKILILIERIKAKPNNFEVNLLKEIKQLGSKIWKKLHFLSESEIHNQPHLFKIAIKIAGILSSAEKAFFWPFSYFYEELKFSYLQLEQELLGLLRVAEDGQYKIKRKKSQVLILE